MSAPEEIEAVERYFTEYFENEGHLPRQERHRLAIGKEGKLCIVQLNWFQAFATKLSRSKCGDVIGFGSLCTMCGIPDANIKRVLIQCLKVGIDKDLVQQLMDHFNQYHTDCPVTWRDLC